MTATHSSASAVPDSRRDNAPVQVALKVVRRKYARNALDELELRRRIGNDDPASRYVLDCTEVFIHDEHVCQVYELHGRDTKFLMEQGPLPLADVKRMTRQVLEALRLMHARGLAHSDIKPDNVLWCGKKQEARVIDFGNAATVLKTGSSIGTREYCPPEMLLGNPMGAPVDLWELGCTVFEWLTGKSLFDPWEACHAKYEEFSDDGEDEEDSVSDEDDIVEQNEQLPQGTLLLGKYRLLREIGRGKCATVWIAEQLHDEPLGEPPPSPEQIKAIAAVHRKSRPAVPGYNIYEVVMGYEHLLLMQERLGRLPESMTNHGKFRHLFYNEEGALRFDPDLKTVSIKDVLVQGHGFAADAAAEMEAFLLGLLQFEPERRLTADEALRSDWLNPG